MSTTALKTTLQTSRRIHPHNTQPVIKLDSRERLGLLCWINITGQISAGFELKIIVPRDDPLGICELRTLAY